MTASDRVLICSFSEHKITANDAKYEFVKYDIANKVPCPAQFLRAAPGWQGIFSHTSQPLLGVATRRLDR